ncbi:MAG TPA: hypothetical protein VG826_13595 [Pirellulales bacterium]|nr:hypothetical protein [Pirellulales bacterium]
MNFKTLTFAVLLLAVGCFAGIVTSQPDRNLCPTAQAEDVAADPARQIAALRAEVERLQKVVPDQAHAMQDVDYHFTNLWFAARQGNWPLAQFYFSETRSHLRWAVRIIPVRKDNAGREIKLEEILQAVENSPLKQLEEAIQSQDSKAFDAAYEFMLSSCYACHKASDKPYLRPRIPERPATTSINLDPHATWPN